MFRSSRGPRRPSEINNNVEGSISKVGHGPAATLLGGASAAWTRSFDMSQYVSKRAPAGLPQRLSSEDILDNVDQELLNSAVDEVSWTAPWYAGKATNATIMQALDGLADGAFVVRDSSSQPGSFALSFRHAGETQHALIHCRVGGKLQLAKCPEHFDTLSAVIVRFSDHYQDTDAPHLPCRLEPTLVSMPEKASAGDGAPNDTSVHHGANTAVLNKVDADGNIVAVSAQTGRAVANAPPLPPRKEKRTSSISSASSDYFQGVPMKAGVMLCPHCSSKQSIKNCICSSCNERLDTGDEDGAAPTIQRNRRSSATRAYTRLMGKSKPQPVPEEAYLPPSPPDHERRLTSDDVVVSPPSVPLASILLKGRRGRGSLGASIQFDEINLVDSRRESLLVRGIVSRVDETFDDLGLYFGQDFTLKSQAADKLKGLHCGAFLVYDSPDEPDEMIITYVNERGAAQHAQIAHTLVGMYIVLPTESAAAKAVDGPHFERLSHLVLHHAGDDPSTPSIFALTEEQHAVLACCDLEDVEDEESDERLVISESPPLTPSAPQLARKAMPTVAPKPPQPVEATKAAQAPQTAAPQATVPAWQKPEMSRAEAVALIEFEPNGSFVVRANHDEEGHHVLSYVLNGALHHHAVERQGETLCLAESKVSFSSLGDLVGFYATPEGEETRDLKCRLRLRRAGPAPAAPLAPGTTALPAPPAALLSGGSAQVGSADAASMHALLAERPLWLQTSLPKAQALQILVNRDDGAFVVRSSESRPDCYVLSYKFRNQVHHELIKVRSTPHGTSFFLNCAPQAAFGSLQALLVHYEHPQPQLKYPLQPALMTARRKRSTRRGRRPSRAPASPSDGLLGSNLGLHAQHAASAVEGGSRSGSVRSESNGHPPAPLLKQASSRSIGPGGIPPPPMARGPPRHMMGRAGERLDQRAAMSNWCCLNLSREEAMAKLPQKEGAFIVRRSEENFGTLSIIANGKAFHAQIEDTTQGLHLKKSAVFQPNLSALIAYYKISTQTDLPRSLLSW